MRAADKAKIDAFRAEATTPPARMSREPVEISPDVMVGRSLRLPTDVYDELMALASEQGKPWSQLVRQWILDGLAAARDGDTDLDPAIELRRAVALISHAAEQIQRRAA